jgi:DEAD/DEAH box helicase domain-containing protein
MKIINSRKILDDSNFEYYQFEDKEELPLEIDKTFGELFPNLANGRDRAKKLLNSKLYKHQFSTLNALENGFNAILISGTGSGKTEAWAIYALKNKKKTLAIYPTIALSQDQIIRLEDYYSGLGNDLVIKVEASTATEVPQEERRRIKEKLTSSLLVITNPAFLLSDLKRFAKRKSPILKSFLSLVDLIVIDELDYYGSSKASLLIEMLKLIIEYISHNKPQICILTATLGNPEELKRILTEINGRQTEIIRGGAFKVRNYTYIIRGKKEAKEGFEEATREDEKDLIDILSKYVLSEEEGVTLVFTMSIHQAEEEARKVRNRLLEKYLHHEVDRVQTHHHLIDKDKREDIERRARNGEVKIIISPRTLTQGIDIGTIIRIIHLGLPYDVREFKQREGRKGRRKEISFTETLIFPSRKWDYKLLESGVENLRKWYSLPLENIYINSQNKYILLFHSLFKCLYRSELTSEEINLLQNLNLIKKYKALDESSRWEPTDKGLNVWEKINFYEYGSPFGIKRLLYPEEKIAGDIRGISWRDLIEKFQRGCFDPTNDRIITKFSKGLRSIIEEDIMEAIRNYKFLDKVKEEYELIKLQWNEEANLLKDYYGGKIQSIVDLYVDPPKEEFGELVEYPLSIRWIIESRKSRKIMTENGVRLIYDKKSIEVPVKRVGYYKSITYGKSYELDPEEDINLIGLGMCYILASLRLSNLSLSTKELKYIIIGAEPIKSLIIWEPEPIGLIKNLDWNKIKEIIEKNEPDFLTEIIMWSIDEEAVDYKIMKGINWNDIKKSALRIIDYLQELIWVKIKDKQINIEKPSIELKIASLAIVPFNTENNRFIAYAIFNGSEFDKGLIDISTPSQNLYSLPFYSDIEKIRNLISNLYDKDFTIVHYASSNIIDELSKGSKSFKQIISILEKENRFIDVHKMIKKIFNIDIAPIEKLEATLDFKSRGFERKITYDILADKYLNYKQGKIDLEKFKEALFNYAEDNAKSIYLMYLACKFFNN